MSDLALQTFERRTRERLERIEAQVKLISDRLGIPFDLPSSNLPIEVAGLVHEGKRIEAIKLYREMTGCSLEEARDAVAAI